CLGRAEGGPDVLATGEFDLVLLDNHLPGLTGLEFMAALQQRDIRLPVILMTNYGNPTTAIQATKLGAYAYVIKPPRLGELFQKLEPLIAEALKIDWRGGRVRMPGQATPEGPSPELLGNSEAMNRVYDLIARCSDRDLPVLIRGETGTGKELVARAVCAYGPRKDRPFVAVACKAFDEDRLEDELFGHELSPPLLAADQLRQGRFQH